MKKWGKWTALTLAAALVLSFFAHVGILKAAAKKDKKTESEAAKQAKKAEAKAANGKIVVKGFDWGPGVDRVVFELPQKAKSVTAKGALVETKGAARVVKGAFLSNGRGERIKSGTSKYVTITLETDFENNGNPFDYDFVNTFMNSWTPDYSLNACFTISDGDESITYGYMGNCGNKTNVISPDTEGWRTLSATSGVYRNPFTGKDDAVTLQRAAFEPEALKQDPVKHPLLIWLHGQGEGGTDPSVVILGNKVSALTKPKIQSRFTTEGGVNGAYVYIVQAPTYWMDEGDGTNGKGDNESRYTEALMNAIATYVAENPDVDTNRIYLSGCSNGGYMTMNMLIHYPDYFAAAIPCCEAYAFDTISTTGDGSAMGGVNETVSTGKRWLTDEKIAAIKHIPIWFLASADDTTVTPSAFELPAYKALLAAGADNTWFSFYDHVRSKDDPKAEIPGHWVWLYYFNDQALGVQDRAAILNSADTTGFGFAPTAITGGPQKAVNDTVVYDGCFEWLNAQSKEAK